MKFFQPPWLSLAILTSLWGSHSVISAPTRPTQTSGRVPDKGWYNLELDTAGRPSAFPFPTDISFEDSFGAASQGDKRPGKGSGRSGCFYEGKPCPGGFPVPGTNTVYPNTTTGVAPTGAVPTSAEPSTTPTLPPSLEDTMADQDIFEPIGTGYPENIPKRDGHFVKNDKIDSEGPISTNKFYANLFLGNQTNYAWTHPYAVGWGKGNNSDSHGLAVSHSEESQRAKGDPQDNIPGKPIKFYANPIGIRSLVLGAEELKEQTTLRVANADAFSAEAIMRPGPDGEDSITFPLLQGMAFVTGVYKNLTPHIRTGIFYKEVVPADSPKEGVFKYKASMESGATWFIYVTPEDGTDPKLKLDSNILVTGPKGFKGTIQVAKNAENGEEVLDKAAGVYPTKGKVEGVVNAADSKGTYTISWEKAGKDAENTPLLMYALPHHVESFDDATSEMKTELKLITTTKGMGVACSGDKWTMVESGLPIGMDLAPWTPDTKSNAALSNAAKEAIKGIAENELTQNMDEQTNINSMYYSGKGLGKFAYAIYAIHELVGAPDVSADALKKLKECFAVFVENKNKLPLVYDTVWKGIVSSGTYETDDPNVDFGNTLYNDHHFHYGYFILSAAIIGRLDPDWIEPNKGYVNALLKDAGNPVQDEEFPFSRAFDWFSGHSWAKGVFDSGDGKDQESTSEDTMFAFAVKMWGKTSGDVSTEARGNMMLAVLKRSLNNYFLMKSDNKNHPEDFIDNKVTGIYFDNKVDHTTYFGANLEYIQGIHMLPLLPNSAYTRDKDFVKQEWDAMFASGASAPADKVEGGWKGVLYSNLALIDPKASWDFFAAENFDLQFIDGGASRIWYLTYAASVGGGPQ